MKTNLLISRRKLLVAGATLFAAPAIVRASSLMPVKAHEWIEPFEVVNVRLLRQVERHNYLSQTVKAKDGRTWVFKNPTQPIPLDNLWDEPVPLYIDNQTGEYTLLIA